MSTQVWAQASAPKTSVFIVRACPIEGTKLSKQSFLESFDDQAHMVRTRHETVKRGYLESFDK